MNECERLVYPATLDEALQLLAEESGAYTIYAGGTDILANVRVKPNYMIRKNLLCLATVDELRAIQAKDGIVSIGAAATFAQIINSPEVQEHAPMLVQAASCVASPQIRNMATLGGNVANASPAADGMTALICLDAKAELCCMRGGMLCHRLLPVAELVTGPGHIARQPEEIITRFIIPSSKGSRFVYEKVGLRSAMAIAVLSVALLVDKRAQQPRVRAALGSLGPKTVVCHEAEALAESGDLYGAVERWMQAITPIDDMRASSEYRRLATRNILLRQLNALLKEER